MSVLIVSGCGDDPQPGTPGDGAMLDQGADRGLADAEVDAAGADADGVDASAFDMRVDAGAGGSDGDMGGAGGMGGPPPPFEVLNCEDACRRYAECDRLDLLGGEQACLDQCGRVTRNDARPDRWWSCLGFEQCNLLQLCQVPEPEPLTCAEVCALADECGVPLVDCVASCEAEATVDGFRRCGEALLDGCGATAGFIECLGREVYPACNTTCERGVACNVIRADGCLLDCVAATADPDPLFSLRAEQRNQCISRAPEDDCLAVNACVNPPRPSDVLMVDRNLLCQRWRACGLDREFGACEELLQAVGAQESNLTCLQDLIINQCPPREALARCFQGGGGDGVGQRAAFCGQLCEAKDVCGLLDENNPLARPECVNGCSDQRGSPDEAERAATELPCVEANRCPDFAACLAQSGPAVECAAYCASLDGCGLADADCLAACDADWPRDRTAAERACVVEAGDDCDAIAACRRFVPPCAESCARELACGQNRENCEGICDDAHFANPDGELLRMACVLSAPLCNPERPDDHAVRDCARQPGLGAACLNYCRATTECGPDGGDLAACLSQCGPGFAGEAGLSYLRGEACLANLRPPADCAELTACIAPPPPADCGAFCQAATDCGLPLTDCANNCANAPLSQLRVESLPACLADQGAEDCAARVACLAPPLVPIEGEVPPALLDIDVLCPRIDACGLEALIGSTCRQMIDNLFNGAIRQDQLRCANARFANGCPGDLLNALLQCFQGGQEPPPPSPTAEPCADLCLAQALCNEDAGANQLVCRRACEARVEDGGDDALARISPRLHCGQAWSCADLTDCLESSAPEAICAAHCARLQACDLVDDLQACQVECDAGFADGFVERACVAEQAGACPAVAACIAPD